VVVTVVVT